SAAATLRALVQTAMAQGVAAGVVVKRRAGTCERLRWEWLAATALVLGGRFESRLLRGGSRILSEGVLRARNGIDSDIAARVRMASAEAFSLAWAIDAPQRERLRVRA